MLGATAAPPPNGTPGAAGGLDVEEWGDIQDPAEMGGTYENLLQEEQGAQQLPYE